jgi:hypothetical protein
MSKEVWKDIKGYDGFYQVSSVGRIRGVKRMDSIGRTRKKSILKLSTSHNGYFFVRLNKNGKGKPIRVNRAVAEAFIPNPENKLVTNHKDCNRKNNKVENLEWATYSENNKYTSLFGNKNYVHGIAHPFSKLTQEKADEIRKKYVKNIVSMRKLADEYGVSVGTIQSLIEKKTWVQKK